MGEEIDFLLLWETWGLDLVLSCLPPSIFPPSLAHMILLRQPALVWPPFPLLLDLHRAAVPKKSTNLLNRNRFLLLDASGHGFSGKDGDIWNRPPMTRAGSTGTLTWRTRSAYARRKQVENFWWHLIDTVVKFNSLRGLRQFQVKSCIFHAEVLFFKGATCRVRPVWSTKRCVLAQAFRQL